MMRRHATRCTQFTIAIFSWCFLRSSELFSGVILQSYVCTIAYIVSLPKIILAQRRNVESQDIPFTQTFLARIDSPKFYLNPFYFLNFVSKENLKLIEMIRSNVFIIRKQIQGERSAFY